MDSSSHAFNRNVPNMPWPELGAGMVAAGWLDANNRRGRIKAGDHDVEVAGVHDSHTGRDRYEDVAGPADPAADVRLGVMHSPEPRVMDRFVADGYNLLLAGHTHGGQLRLPLYGALVTNCGLDPRLARGLHRYPAVTWHRLARHLAERVRRARHVALGADQVLLPPEATLLTLVPRIG